ncbi:MAG: DUF2273 domain-containing protein [Bacillota bacterium]|nr:DUF2273 domain-containing protein [Bacillota bacterium]
MENNIIRFVQEHPGKIIGGLVGLILAVLFVIFGFWKGLFIILSILAGIYLGGKAENNEGFRNFLDRFPFLRERF